MNARIVTLACALCLGVGLVIGRLGVPPAKAPVQAVPSDAATPLTAAGAPEAAPARTPTPREARDALALIRSGQPDDLADAIPLIRHLTLTECKEAWRLLGTVQGNIPLLQAVARQWAALDPEDAFESALIDRRRDFRDRLGFAAGRALARADVEGALRRVSSARLAERRHRIASWIVPEVAKTDPERAAVFLTSDKRFSDNEELYRQVALEYGRIAPDAALTWAASLGNSKMKDSILQHAWLGWSKNDPAGAAARISTLARDQTPPEVYSALANSWSRSHPAAALAWVQSISDEELRGRAFQSFEVDVWAVGKDAARDFVTAIEEAGRQSDLARSIAQQLLVEGTAEAVAWAEKLPPGKAREGALQPIVHAWAENEPAEAARYLTTQTAEVSGAMRHALARWAEAEPDAAFGFAQQFAAQKQRDEAIGAAIQGVRSENPAKALEWLGEIHDAGTLGNIGQDLVAHLARSDPGTAKTIALQLPTEAQPAAFQNLIRGWAFDQTSEAGHWINSLPEGKGRDSAIRAYVSVIDGMDARLATHWSQSIQDPEIRAETFLNVFQRWQGQDRAAAESWLAANRLPEDPFRPVIELFIEKERRNQSK